MCANQSTPIVFQELGGLPPSCARQAGVGVGSALSRDSQRWGPRPDGLQQRVEALRRGQAIGGGGGRQAEAEADLRLAVGQLTGQFEQVGLEPGGRH